MNRQNVESFLKSNIVQLILIISAISVSYGMLKSDIGHLVETMDEVVIDVDTVENTVNEHLMNHPDKAGSGYATNDKVHELEVQINSAVQHNAVDAQYRKMIESNAEAVRKISESLGSMGGDIKAIRTYIDLQEKE